MEPREDNLEQTPETYPENDKKKRRFRIVKLEERIAPSSGGGTKNCNQTQHGHTCACYHTYMCR